jgi:hypothetical protein
MVDGTKRSNCECVSEMVSMCGDALVDGTKRGNCECVSEMVSMCGDAFFPVCLERVRKPLDEIHKVCLPSKV